jgi:hypothetical protein
MGQWKDIYGHRPGAPIEKLWSQYRQGGKTPIHILNAGQEEHAMLRKWAAPNFSDGAMRQQGTMIGGYVDLLMKRLAENCQEGQEQVNLREWCKLIRSQQLKSGTDMSCSPRRILDNFTTFDIIGKLALSSDFGCLESSKYHPWVEAISFSLRENTILREIKRNGFGFLMDWLSKTKLAKSRMALSKYTRDKLVQRIDSGKQPDLIEGFLHNKDSVVSREIHRFQIARVQDIANLTQDNRNCLSKNC